MHRIHQTSPVAPWLQPLLPLYSFQQLSCLKSVIFKELSKEVADHLFLFNCLWHRSCINRSSSKTDISCISPPTSSRYEPHEQSKSQSYCLKTSLHRNIIITIAIWLNFRFCFSFLDSSKDPKITHLPSYLLLRSHYCFRENDCLFNHKNRDLVTSVQDIFSPSITEQHRSTVKTHLCMFLLQESFVHPFLIWSHHHHLEIHFPSHSWLPRHFCISFFLDTHISQERISLLRYCFFCSRASCPSLDTEVSLHERKRLVE